MIWYDLVSDSLTGILALMPVKIILGISLTRNIPLIYTAMLSICIDFSCLIHNMDSLLRQIYLSNTSP